MPQWNGGDPQSHGIPGSHIADQKIITEFAKGKELEHQDRMLLALLNGRRIEHGLGQEKGPVEAVQAGHQPGHHRWHPQEQGNGAAVRFSGY